MNSLITRTVSALVALVILGGSFYLWQTAGLKVLILLVVLIGTWELTEVLFKDTRHALNKFIFFLFSLLIFLLSSAKPAFSGLIYSFFLACFCVASLSLNKRFHDLSQLATYQAKGALGFFYMGLLPGLIVALLDLPRGFFWFLSLLGIVFAGDIGAYLVGILWGRRKILPSISPKKTLEGALGGLCFSLLTGLLLSLFFSPISIVAFVGLSFVTGIFAQFGDFFESLLKRVADVKDSGTLMPGHGGVLDRIDGVLFASPIFLLGAILLENLL